MDSTIVTASSSQVVQVGSIIKFGKYDWQVLDVQEDKALLFTDKVTHVNIPYHITCEDVTWESCSLRKWLNNEFFHQEFTTQEREKIALTTIQNESNQWYGTRGGNETSDYIFLLSVSEVVHYFGDSGQLNNRPGKGTSYIDDSYNNARITKSIGKEKIAWWWLRTPGIRKHSAFINYDGYLLVHGYRIDNNNSRGGVRPALLLKL